jgi:VIT1/CCC1 family predicted Fe2+/Mn2+ transporter
VQRLRSIRWQAQAVLATSVIRATLIIYAAVFFQRLGEVLVATLIAACMRLGLLAYFIARLSPGAIAA